MARPLRVEFPGAVYHVTSRGNARQAIFLDKDDRESFLGVLSSVAARFKWVCHAYCLMETHYHLQVEKEGKSGKPKDEIMYRAYVGHGYRRVQIAGYLGVHYAAISRAIKRGERLGTMNAGR